MTGRYRVWIVRYESRQPDTWHAVPPGAIAVEPAERGTMSVRYLGDPQPGETVAFGA